MRSRAVILSLGLLLLAGLAPSAADEPEKEEKFGLRAGEQTPFVVVDFAAGPFRRAGCPFVMIANHDKRGVVVLTNGKDALAAAFDLVRALDGPAVDGKKSEGYVVAFAGKAADFKDAAVKNFAVGVPRHTWEELGVPKDADLIVVLVEGHKVKASWFLAAKGYKEKRDPILKEAEKFAREAPEKRD